jgi:hypothetical protein
VLPLVAHVDKTFPLYDILTKVAPDCALPNIVAFAAARNPEIPVDALTHFAVGIFWKASVHHWMGDSSRTQIRLGPYEEKIRSYVLNPQDEPFPDNVTLMVLVLPPPKVPMLANHPMEGPRGEGFRNFRFYIPGIQFVLSVGKGVERDVCFKNNPLHPICIQDAADTVERDPNRMYLKVKEARALRGQRQ